MTASFPFFKKTPAALPAQTPPPPAPAPPVVAPAPPPPAPAQVPALAVRDKAFFAYAAALLASALQPPGFHVSDREQANGAGEALARLLDSGTVPKGCVIASRVIIRAKADGKRHGAEGAPEPAPLMDLIAQKEALEAGRSGKGVGPARFAQSMTAAQQAEAETRLGWAGGDKLPSRKEAEDSAAAAGEALADISEPVRHVALIMAYGRILLRSDVTGAPHRLQEAVDIVIAEVERARTIFEANAIPSGALRSEEEATALGSLAFPYPTSLGVDMLGLALSGMPDLSAFEERISALEARWAAPSGDEAKPA